MLAKPRLCVDCRWYDLEWAQGDPVQVIDIPFAPSVILRHPPEHPRCRNDAASSIDLVTGGPLVKTAREMRYGGKCGADATLWEVKQDAAP